MLRACAGSEGPDQTAHSRSLIWAFAVRLYCGTKTYSKVSDLTKYLCWDLDLYCWHLSQRHRFSWRDSITNNYMYMHSRHYLARTVLTLSIGEQTGLCKQIRQRRTRHLIRAYTVCYSSSNILDTSTGKKMDFSKFQDKHSKELRCPNT